MGFDQLLDGGYMNRDRGSASILFCPSMPFQRGHYKYVCTGAGEGNFGLDLRDVIAANDYQSRWQYPGYIMRNKIPNENLNPLRAFTDYSFHLSQVSASKTAFLSDRTALGTYTPGVGTGAPYVWKSYHRSNYNVWYFDGSVRAITKSALVTLFVNGGDDGSTFIAFDSR
jgi:prepilin-type processing-associated H-X9-DG protein